MALLLLPGLVPLPDALLGVVAVLAGLALGTSRTPRDVMLKDACPPGQIGKVFGFVSAGLPLGSPSPRCRWLPDRHGPSGPGAAGGRRAARPFAALRRQRPGVGPAAAPAPVSPGRIEPMTKLRRRLHRWLGFGSAPGSALLGLTGALMVFMPELEARQSRPRRGPRCRWRNWSPPPRRPCPTAQGGRSASGRPAGRARAPAPISAWPAGRTWLHLDPASGEVLGEVRWAAGWSTPPRPASQPTDGPSAIACRLPRCRCWACCWRRAALGCLAISVVSWRERSSPIAGCAAAGGWPTCMRRSGCARAAAAVAAGTGLGVSFPQHPHAALYRVMPAYHAVSRRRAGHLPAIWPARWSWPWRAAGLAAALLDPPRPGAPASADHGACAARWRLARARSRRWWWSRRPARPKVVTCRSGGRSAPGSPRCTPAPSRPAAPAVVVLIGLLPAGLGVLGLRCGGGPGRERRAKRRVTA